jgi:ribonuclease HI
MIEIYFDGACEPINSGGTAAYGFLIKKDNKTIFEDAKIIGSGDGMTNNLAEYQGLVSALHYLTNQQSELAKHPLTIFTDSNLVYNMISKNWGWNKKKTVWQPHKNHPHLKKLLFEALLLLEKFNYQIKWIPREQNQRADYLSKKPLFEAGLNTAT